MRILFLAFLNSTHPQIIRKVSQQAKAMRIHNPDTLALVIGQGVRDLQEAYPDLHLFDSQNIAAASDHEACSLFQFKVAEKVTQTLQPDIVYLRYTDVDRPWLDFVQKYPVVLEHQTIEPKQYELAHPPEWLVRNERELGPKVRGAARGLVSVTHEINTFELTYADRAPPGHVMGNGIEADTVPKSSRQITDHNVHVLVSAHFRPWHGYERLIEGMRRQRGKVIFHFVGDGAIIQSYQEGIRRYGLASHFIFYGQRDPHFIDQLAEKCHIGVGSLGHHRKGMIEQCALKAREYCARGLPFFFAGLDTDFDDALSFIQAFPADDTPISGQEIEAFGRATLAQPGIGDNMRSYLVEHVAWPVKMKRLLGFFHQVGDVQAKILGFDEATSRVKDALRTLSSTPPNDAPSKQATVVSGGLLIIRSHIGNYSETFLDDHETYLARGSKTLYGFPLPHMLRNGGNILSDDEKRRIQIAGSESESVNAYTPALAKWLEKVKPSTVLVETALMAVRVHPACEKAGIPYVVHFHGLDAYDKTMLERYRSEYKAFFKGCQALVVVSRAMKAQLLSLGAPEEKVILSPYGVNPDLPALSVPGNCPPHFLAVGRFVEKKAPEKTLMAFAEVLKDVSTAHLTMVGDGDLLPTCQELAKKLKCDHAVTFTGALPREAVSKLMSEVRVFVQHSVTASTGDAEGLPLGILEAAAHGLPVISTIHAGIPDAIKTGEGGILVAEHDVSAMTEAMLKLAQDPELAGQMGAAARQRVLKRFSRERSHQRLRKILEYSANTRLQDERASLDPQSDETIHRSIQKATTPRQALQLANALREIGKAEWAEAALLRAIALDRNCAQAYLKLAQFYIPKERFAEAFLALHEASRIGELPEAMQTHLPSLQTAAQGEAPLLTTYLKRTGAVEIGRTEKPQRILVFTNLFPPQEMGGYGRTVWEFCDLLQKRGHTLRILTGNVPHLAKTPEPGYERIEQHVRRDLELFGDWVDGKAVAKTDKDGMLAIARQNRERILAERETFKPTVCMAGNLDFLGAGFLEPLLKQGLPILHRLGNFGPGYITAETPASPLYCIAGCSQWLNDQTHQEGWAAKRFEVVHPGSPLETYYRAFPPAFDQLRICFASLIMPYKGPQILMQALVLLHKLKVPFECTFAGDSTDPDFLDDLKTTPVEHGFHDQVHFPGFLDRTGLAALYAKSNVMVFPSVFEEPFGKSQIEAMAAGLPVITSATGGSREIVQDEVNGLYYKNEDAEDLARQLFILQSHPDSWQRYSQQAQADAFNFTTLNSVRKIEEIYQSLLETRMQLPHPRKGQA